MVSLSMTLSGPNHPKSPHFLNFWFSYIFGTGEATILKFIIEEYAANITRWPGTPCGIRGGDAPRFIC